MSDDSLRHQAKRVLDQNRYMTLGTTEADGRPRVSPVYYTHDDYRDVYWVSSPEATHSQNLAARPDVVAVVFDSTATVGNTAAVYLTGRGRMVPDVELDQECSRAFQTLSGGARPFTPAELSGAARLRLYHATVVRHEVHVRGSDPDRGRGVDTRATVEI